MSVPNPADDVLRIAVFAGGESAEREISLQSGAAVARALSERGHDVVTVDPADEDIAAWDGSGIDAVFLALHGPFGEDGTVQQILETAGIPYTGSDAVTSRLAFSKSAAKERFFQRHVPTPAYVLIHESDDAARIEAQARKLGYPLVVKPDAQGSSLGVSIVASPEELPAALSRCFHLDAFGLLEQAIEGTEWTVGVFDDDPLPAIQIVPGRDFYDYAAKYADDATQYLFEFDLPVHVIQAIQSAGVHACRALGTRGVARADLRVDRFGQPWVLEVNTIPGFTDHSLIPKAAGRVGIGFADLCERLVRSCLATGAARPHT